MEKMNLMIGRILLSGVALSLVLVVPGGSVWLFLHGGEPVNFQAFRGEPLPVRSIVDIFMDIFSFSPLALIQMGSLVLVLLQVVRTGVTAIEFGRSREWGYVAISLFVLTVLIFGLAGSR